MWAESSYWFLGIQIGKSDGMSLQRLSYKEMVTYVLLILFDSDLLILMEHSSHF